MLDVGALIAFAAVIDTGSFSNAAERLGQTPSGVSRTISRLEQQLGMTLIHRTTRDIARRCVRLFQLRVSDRINRLQQSGVIVRHAIDLD